MKKADLERVNLECANNKAGYRYLPEAVVVDREEHQVMVCECGKDRFRVAGAPYDYSTAMKCVACKRKWIVIHSG